MICILGRNQAPTWAVENRARAFFGKDEKAIETGTTKIPQTFQMKKGTHEWVESWEMVDPRCQILIKTQWKKLNF